MISTYHIDPFTSLTVRIFLPESAFDPPERDLKAQGKTRVKGALNRPDLYARSDHPLRRNSMPGTVNAKFSNGEEKRRNSYGNEAVADGLGSKSDGVVFRGYAPSMENCRKLPVMLQFHGGGRIAKLCDVIVLAVGYRLAPESRYPAAFEDVLKVLHWLGKLANLAECSKSMGNGRVNGGEMRKADGRRHIVDTFGASMVEPWFAAPGNPSSCGSNIADFVSRKAVETGKLLDPVKFVAQVLMYPFVVGNVPPHSEIKLANSYFYDKAMCMLAWKIFLTEVEFIPGRGTALKLMPPTLTIVAEHDWMRDRAIAYSAELRKVNLDAPVLEYKDAVHDFATSDMLLKTPQARGLC
uniref:Alpha/beta hydrolase fold-3 domain-containing protein n=1 Tax=Kalanchoe fedtschenkoi TaxID=63787 RepID=A0A7N0V7S3_KALFE